MIGRSKLNAMHTTARWRMPACLVVCAVAIASLAGCTAGPFASGTPIAGPPFAAPPGQLDYPRPYAIQPGVTAPAITLPAGPPSAVISPPANSTPTATPYYTSPPAPRPIAAPICPPPIVAAPMPGMRLTPAKVIAPVGSDVVFNAGVCLPDGTLSTGERIEWTLADEGVGQFIAPGKLGWIDRLMDCEGACEKVDNTYAVGKTCCLGMTLTRGTPVCNDDVIVLAGQSWISVSSPVEGTSYVTAYAPGVPAWDLRRQTAQIHWVDVQWQVPSPSVGAAGASQPLATLVSRQSDGSPLAGWTVRYQIVDGPPAALGPNGDQTIDAITDSLGQATAQLTQTAKNPGTNNISVQIIRPADASRGITQPLVVGHGSTVQTWSADALSLRSIVPGATQVGATATCGIHVSNPSNRPARSVVVTAKIPPQLEFLNSNPQAERTGDLLRWSLDELSAGQSRQIQVNMKPRESGAVRWIARAAVEGIAPIESSAHIAVAEPSVLELALESDGGESEATVGEKLKYRVRLNNRGAAPITGILLRDEFKGGLKHEAGASPVTLPVADLAPGETRQISVTFEVVEPGMLRQTLTATADGDVRSQTEASIRAVAPRIGPQADMQAKLICEPRAHVGQVVGVTLEIRNTGDATLNEIEAIEQFDQAIEPIRAKGFVARDGKLVWRVESLLPGESIRAEVHYRCRSAAPSACIGSTIVCREQLERPARSCIEIAAVSHVAYRGEPQLRLMLREATDPIRVGDRVDYILSLENDGPESADGASVEATLPPELRLLNVNASGPTAVQFDGQTIRFAPALVVRPGEPALEYRFSAEATSAGVFAVEARADSDKKSTATVAKETTQIID
jgi:uncharacterized repeat protein (TIGR01451 family)